MCTDTDTGELEGGGGGGKMKDAQHGCQHSLGRERVSEFGVKKGR